MYTTKLKICVRYHMNNTFRNTIFKNICQCAFNFMALLNSIVKMAKISPKNDAFLILIEKIILGPQYGIWRYASIWRQSHHFHCSCFFQKSQGKTSCIWNPWFDSNYILFRSSHRRCSVKKGVLSLQLYLKRDFGTGVFLWILRNF